MDARRVSVLILALTSACGSSSNAPALADASSDTSSIEGSVGDSAVVDSASSPTDSASSDPRLFPIAVGRSWTFATVAADGGTGSCTGTQTSTVVGPGATYAGQPSLRYRPVCSTTEVDLVGTGDKLLQYQIGGDGTAYLFHDEPVVDGHSWTYSAGTTFVWRSAPPVTVPAGTFTECWNRVIEETPEYVVTYCRGVGPVRIVAAQYRAELTAKNF
jgi:hypothetical protein